MGPRASMLYSYEDPWRASAFVFVITQLLLTVLVLVHTILVCITSQLLKWYGWWIPSCRNSAYGHAALDGFDSYVTKKPFNVDSNASKTSLLIKTERFLKQSQSEDWWSAKSEPLVCPKCHGIWTFKQGFSFKNGRSASSRWGETPPCSDVGTSRDSHEESGFRSKHVHNTKISEATDQFMCMKVCSEASNSIEQSVNNASGTKTCDAADQAASENLCFETRKKSLNDANTPIDIRKWPQTAVNEDGMFTDRFAEEAGSSSKVFVGDGQRRVSFKSVALEMTHTKLESAELPWHIGEEMQDEGFDEELSAVMKRKVDTNDNGSESSANDSNSKDEEYCGVKVKKGNNESYDSESLIKGLRQAIDKDRKKLCSLYAELEVERIASETAANEAMLMISRLQEEKAALLMQAAHYQRMAEEKANYDEQAMQLLKEILYRKERENYLLEKEVKVMRTKFCKDVRKFGKKRHDVERRSFFVKGEETLLLKNVEEGSNLGKGQDIRNGVQELSNVGVLVSVEKPHPSQITEEQPLKRLKGIGDHENGISQSTLLVSDMVHIASSEGDLKAQKHIKEPDKSRQPVVAMAGRDNERVFRFGLRKQGCEKMLNASEEGENFSEVCVPLDLAQSASSAMDSGQESCHFVRKNQKLLCFNGEEAELLPLLNVSKANEVEKSGDASHEEAEDVCSNQGTSDFCTRCSLDGVPALMPCGEASSGVSANSAECLQSIEFESNDLTRKDLQTRLQIFESDMTLWSCPSSLNNKGSGKNMFEESDSSLLRSHVH